MQQGKYQKLLWSLKYCFIGKRIPIFAIIYVRIIIEVIGNVLLKVKYRWRSLIIFTSAHMRVVLHVLGAHIIGALTINVLTLNLSIISGLAVIDIINALTVHSLIVRWIISALTVNLLIIRYVTVSSLIKLTHQLNDHQC